MRTTLNVPSLLFRRRGLTVWRSSITSTITTARVRPRPSSSSLSQKRFYSPRSHTPFDPPSSPSSSSRPSSSAPHHHHEVDSLERERERLILQEPMFKGSEPKPRLSLPILFTLVVTGVGIGVAALRTNEETEKWRRKVMFVPSILPWGVSSFSAAMYGEWRQAKGREWQNAFDDFQKKTVAIPAAVRGIVNYSYYYVAQSWVNLTEGKEMSYKLVGCFAAVWLAGLIPSARGVVHRMFSHDPLSGRVTTLFTSQFGHGGLLHLAVNSFALIGFGELAWSYLRHKQINTPNRLDEARSGYHFLAFHLAAGTVSALTSHLFAARILYPRLIASLSKQSASVAATTTTAAAATGVAGAGAASAAIPSILPSTGASGAIWASLMVTALAWPHTTVTLVFLPFFPISIGTGVFGLVALDIIGLLRGWRFFDHAGHLGGAAFGAAYFYYGPEWWDWWRQQMKRNPLSSRGSSPSSSETT